MSKTDFVTRRIGKSSHDCDHCEWVDRYNRGGHSLRETGFHKSWMKIKHQFSSSFGWLHRCSCKKREARTIPANFPSTGELVAIHSHKRKSNRDMRGVQEKHFTNERIRIEQQEVRVFFKNSKQKEQSKENRQLYRDSQAECHTGLLLEESRNRILLEAKSQMLVHVSRRNVQQMPSENWTHNFALTTCWNLPLRSGIWSFTERASLASCSTEKAHWDARIEAIQDVEEMKEICFCGGEGAQELRESDFPDTKCGKASSQQIS